MKAFHRHTKQATCSYIKAYIVNNTIQNALKTKQNKPYFSQQHILHTGCIAQVRASPVLQCAHGPALWTLYRSVVLPHKESCSTAKCAGSEGGGGGGRRRGGEGGGGYRTVVTSPSVERQERRIIAAHTQPKLPHFTQGARRKRERGRG